MIRKTTVAAAAAILMGLPALAACDVPMPPVDGIEQKKADQAQERALAAERAQAAATAQAQQVGLIEGGPSDVTAAQRLQFLQSQDITIEYSAFTFSKLNDQSSEITIPANSRVIREGQVMTLAEVPAAFTEGQMLPKADLNGFTVTILSMSVRTDALVLKVLGGELPYKLETQGEGDEATQVKTPISADKTGVLTLKAPDELKDLCEEAPGVDCSGRNLFGRDWTGKVLNGIIVRNANATNLTAAGTSLTNSDFSGAQLFRGNFLGANVTGSKFRGIKGQNVMFNSDNKTGATMTKASDTDFTGSYMYRCEFDYTEMKNSVWDRTDAQNCTFDFATMDGFRAANAWLHRIKASSVSMKNAIAPNVRFSQGTFTKSDLSGSVFSGGLLDRIEATAANFSNVVLTGKNCTMAQSYLDSANLSGLQASGCTFPRASMKKATVTRANLSSADLTYTDLKGADFTKANLTGANLFNADTKGAIFTGASIQGLVCPNGDIVGKTAYGRYGNQVVTNCSWNDRNYSISGRRIFKSKSVPVGTVKYSGIGIG